MQQSQIDKLSSFFRKQPAQSNSQAFLHTQPPHHSPSPQHQHQHSPSKRTLHTKQIRRMHNRKYNPYSFTKLTDQQKLRAFLSLYEDLIHTKASLQQQVETIKRLKTKLHKIEEDFAAAKKMGQMTAPEKIRVEKEKDEEYLQMKNENRRLLEKINSLELPKPQYKKYSKPVVAKKKQQKTAYPVNELLVAELTEQKATVRELLEMVGSLKRDKLALEEQLKERQRGGGSNQGNQSMMMQQKSQLRQSKMVGATEQAMEQVMQDLAMEREKKLQLQLAYERLSTNMTQKVKALSQQLHQQRQSRQKKQKQQSNLLHRQLSDPSQSQLISQLTRSRDKYESQLRRMVESPFYVDHKDQFQLQNKVRDLESKLKSKQNQINNLKEEAVKVLSELEFKKKEVVSLKQEVRVVKKDNLEMKERELGKRTRVSGGDLEDYYRKALNLAKWQGDDPIWKKYSTLAKPQFTLLSLPQLKTLTQKMWLQKLQLLAHLQKAQTHLKSSSEQKSQRYQYLQTQKSTLQQKLHLALTKLDQYSAMLAMRKGYTDKIYTQHGVSYDDSVSVFEEGEQQWEEELRHLEASENYLDLYLGEMVLEDMAVSQQVRGVIRDVKNLMSFLTVDFYNHDTDHSNVAEGLRFDFRYRMSFRVQVDQTLVNYLERDSLKIELWGSEGSSAPLIGTANITLKELIARSQDSISPVVHSKAPLYGQDHVLLGVIDYRIRMRLPISPLLKWLRDRRTQPTSTTQPHLDILSLPDSHRRLSLTIQRALNLPDQIQAFIYFTLQHQDCYTQPQKGPAPLWDYHRQLDIIYSPEFQQELKTKYVEFTVFDDRKPMGEDVYGVAQVDFTELLTRNVVEVKAEIKNGVGQKAGLLMLKAAWV